MSSLFLNITSQARTWLIMITMVFTNVAFGQWVIISETGEAADSSSALEIRDTSRGVLTPRLSSSQIASISSPTEGLLLYNTDSSAYFFYNGSAWQPLVGNANLNTNSQNSGVALLYDKKTQGTSGGTFTGTTLLRRTLNTIDGDTSFAKLVGTDAFSLDPGIYYIKWSAPFYKVDLNKTRLYNNSTSTVLKYGGTGRSASGGVTQNISFGYHVLEISTRDTFLLQHYCQTTRSTDGFGVAANLGDEIYTQIRIQKIN